MRQRQVPLTTLDRLLAAFGPGAQAEVDAAKVDCEGCEWGVLAGLLRGGFELVGELHYDVRRGEERSLAIYTYRVLLCSCQIL